MLASVGGGTTADADGIGEGSSWKDGAGGGTTGVLGGDGKGTGRIGPDEGAADFAAPSDFSRWGFAVLGFCRFLASFPPPRSQPSAPRPSTTSHGTSSTQPRTLVAPLFSAAPNFVANHEPSMNGQPTTSEITARIRK